MITLFVTIGFGFTFVDNDFMMQFLLDISLDAADLASEQGLLNFHFQ
jgi:hypothetical protein